MGGVDYRAGSSWGGDADTPDSAMACGNGLACDGLLRRFGWADADRTVLVCGTLSVVLILHSLPL